MNCRISPKGKIGMAGGESRTLNIQLHFLSLGSQGVSREAKPSQDSSVFSGPLVTGSPLCPPHFSLLSVTSHIQHPEIKFVFLILKLELLQEIRNFTSLNMMLKNSPGSGDAAVTEDEEVD